MKYLFAIICLLLGSFLFLIGCSKPSIVKKEEGQYVTYSYSSNNHRDYKAPVTSGAPEKIKDQEKYLEIYHRQRQPHSLPIASPQEPALALPLAKMEDIDAVKKLVTDLKGSVSQAKNRAITSVRLAVAEEGAGLTVESMQIIGRLADLESFSFEGAAFDDTLIAELKNLKKIKSVSVSNGGITAESLEIFAGYPELTTLELRRDLQLDNAALDVLQKMPKLEKLSVLYNSFNNSGMNKISKVLTLKSVDVRGCEGVSDNGAKYLAKLPEVEELYFRALITNAGVEYLTTAPKLRFIEFQDCNDIDAGSVDFFKQMSALRELRIFRCKSFDDEAVAGIATIPFERLELRDINLSNEGIAALKGMKTLKVLELSELPSVSAEGLNDLLATLSGLEEVNFFFIPLDDTAMAHIATNMSQLKRLTIRTVGMTDAGITELLKLKSLEMLDIRENAKFTPAALASLSQMKTLKRLYVSGTCLAARDNAEVLQSIRKSLPQCQVID